MLGGLSGLYTEGQVVDALVSKLKLSHPGTQEDILTLSFIPQVGKSVQEDIGLFEKLLRGNLKVGEPLSFFDMKRFLVGGRTMIARHDIWGRVPKVEVVHLSHLEIEGGHDAANGLKQSQDAILVNVNDKLNEPPKWVVINQPNSSSRQAFCEMPLTEKEKIRLESTFGFGDITYLGGTADSQVSTGYSAIAWLNENDVFKAWNFDVNADYAELVKTVLFVMHGGDGQPLKFNLTKEEYDKYVSPEAQHFLSKKMTTPDFYSPHILLGTAVSNLTDAASAGQFKGEIFTPGDLQAVLKLICDANYSVSDITDIRDQGRVTNVPGLALTLTDNGIIEQSTSKSTSTIRIPDKIDEAQLNSEHRTSCSKTNTNARLLELYSAPRYHNHSYNSEQNYAILMLFTFVRVKSKSAILNIHLPEKFELGKPVQDAIVNLLSQNAYVTELNINEHASLLPIKQALKPILARNRWLRSCGYRPPPRG